MPDPYLLRISRRTVDKLGVKLYDRVSAVVAELAANSYDADAENVTVRLPLSTLLARMEEGEVHDRGFVIEVEDDGHGMNPQEARDHYLKVGIDRRKNPEQGATSRSKKRPVMGRKGIGKLAPFGVCRRIEVVSAGEPRTADGYRVSHFFLDYDDIISDDDEPVTLETGDLDETFKPEKGTIVRLSSFLPKRVPDAETTLRQLARRFGPTCEAPDFVIEVCNNRPGEDPAPRRVGKLDIPLMEETLIDLASRPVKTETEETLPVQGWIAMARDPFKHEETAGVAIYARGKIVATTRDFEQPAGFTGEFAARSYLVGEVAADWLDDDDGEDLIRTDRQGILWDSERGRSLREWGAALIKEVARTGREPRRERVRNLFLERSGIAGLARERYGDPDIVDAAIQLAHQIGSFAAEDELEDGEYVGGLTEVILSVAPHRALIGAFQRIREEELGRPVSVDDLLDLSGKTLVAELASYGQMAMERVRVIAQLETVILQESDEAKLQYLLATWPWLIQPTWTPITANQALKTVKTHLEKWLADRGTPALLAIGFENKRPDFTLISVGHRLRIVEIKAAGHAFDDDDCERLLNYVQAFEDFFGANPALQGEFPAGWQIDLIADSEELTKPANRIAYQALVDQGRVRQKSWVDFLQQAKQTHEAFLEARDEARRILEGEAHGE